MPGQNPPRLLDKRQAATHATSWAMLFASLGLGACLDMQGSPDCTPADTTHSCCVKNNPTRPEVCDGREGMSNGPIGRKVAVAATLALPLNDADTFETARPEIEDILVRCVRQAEDEINRTHLGGRKTRRDECDKEIEKKPNGSPVTQAMRWGLEKQRVHQKKGSDLTGTLEPDVVIHSGDPLRPWAVYDFKFPCPEDNPPSWSRYPSGHPYQGRSQGEMYGRALGRPAARVAPGWGIIRSSTW
jgi:hypothetical protein